MKKGRCGRCRFCSVPELISAINDYLEAHNDTPKPFVWTASMESIMEKI